MEEEKPINGFCIWSEHHGHTFQGIGVLTITSCSQRNKRMPLWSVAAGGGTPERRKRWWPLAQGRLGKYSWPDNWNKWNMVSARCFSSSLSLSLSLFKLHFEDKTLVSMPRDLNEQHAERGLDVTIIPKLICLQSQVLRASSVQSVERQRHAEKGKSFLNNVLLWYSGWSVTTPEGSAVS